MCLNKSAIIFKTQVRVFFSLFSLSKKPCCEGWGQGLLFHSYKVALCLRAHLVYQPLLYLSWLTSLTAQPLPPYLSLAQRMQTCNHAKHSREECVCQEII